MDFRSLFSEIAPGCILVSEVLKLVSKLKLEGPQLHAARSSSGMSRLGGSAPLGLYEGGALPHAVLSFLPPRLASAVWSFLSLRTAGEGDAASLFRRNPEVRAEADLGFSSSA